MTARNALERRAFFRRFLGRSLAPMAAFAALPWSRRAGAAGSGRRFVVVGAGASGLAAAAALREGGADAIVIEARSRIGGRIHSSRLWGENACVDLGAAWIQGARNHPAMQVAKAEGFRTYRMNEGAYRFYLQNGAPAEISGSLERRFESVLDRALDNATEAQSVAAALDESGFWSRFGADERPIVRYLLHTYLEQEFAADLSSLSATRFDEGKALRGGDYLVPGGYDRFCQHLARRLDVRLNTEVRRVALSPTGVNIETAHGSLDADGVIVTVPLGVLKANRIQFEPALPASIRSAVSALGMGTMNKCILRFPKLAWPVKTEWFGVACSGTGPWAEFVNLYPATGQPILVGLNVGPQAEALEAHADHDLQSAMQAALRNLFGRQLPDADGVQVTRWKGDPLSMGAYSHLAPGATPRHRAALGIPFASGRIVFAGEATSVDYPATVQGAYQSGRRAAATLLAGRGGA